MLEITNLVKHYGNFCAVDHLNLTIEAGSIFGFVGPNGAGKTTTMKIVSGLLTATSGQVVMGGTDVTREPRALREKIGYMPDFFGVYDNLKVDEYMDFYAGTYAIPYGKRGEIINNLLELVDLEDKKDVYVDVLSRGMKQRLCLARSLIHDPEILVLDEPASGLDPRARVEMKEVLKQLKTLGKTIIISSHILPELAEMCTTVGIINQGKLVAQGTVTEIKRSLTQKRVIHLKPLEKLNELTALLLEKADVSNIVENTEDIAFGFAGEDDALAALLAEIVAKGIPVVTFKEKEGNLEDIFMQLTKGDESVA